MKNENLRKQSMDDFQLGPAAASTSVLEKHFSLSSINSTVERDPKEISHVEREPKATSQPHEYGGESADVVTVLFVFNRSI